MIEYIKIIILSVFTGVLLPLPTSAAAHYSYLNIALEFSQKQDELGFYYSVMTLVFAIVCLLLFRNNYVFSVKAALNGKSKAEKKMGKNLLKGILISFAVSLVLCLPVSKDRLLMDYFDLFLKGNSIILTSLSCVVSGFILITAIWYTSKSERRKLRTISYTSSVRFSFYQLLSYVIPGLSHVSGGCANLLISDVAPERLMANLYTYMAPQMFLISLIKVIRAIAGDMVINPVFVIICVIVSAVTGGLFASLCARVNMRKLMIFFSAYSIIIGLFIAIGSFII